MALKLCGVGMQHPASPASRVSQWIAGLLGSRKAEPYSPAGHATVQVPRDELERLSETSPHLLADIGIVPASSAGETSAWQLEDGRQLRLHPPRHGRPIALRRTE